MAHKTTPPVSFGLRVGQVIADLDLIPAQAARLAGIDPGRLHHIIKDADYPRPATREKMTRGWGVPEYVFYMTREQAADDVEAAKERLKKSPIAA